MVKFLKTEAQTFRRVDEIQPGYYSRPLSATFESIDAIRTGEGGFDELFKMTVSTEHGIKTKGLENLLPKLTIGKAIRLYFVVPTDVYQTFSSQQKYITAKGEKAKVVPRWITENVEQWALKLDYTSF